jgi:hypothetical protein
MPHQVAAIAEDLLLAERGMLGWRGHCTLRKPPEDLDATGMICFH